jgi:hypothetical protein
LEIGFATKVPEMCKWKAGADLPVSPERAMDRNEPSKQEIVFCQRSSARRCVHSRVSLRKPTGGPDFFLI